MRGVLKYWYGSTEKEISIDDFEKIDIKEDKPKKNELSNLNETRTYLFTDFHENALASCILDDSIPDIKGPELYLKQALDRMKNLERETDFLYKVVLLQHCALQQSNIKTEKIEQECSKCGDNFAMNSNTACNFHTGNLTPVTFRKLPETVIKSYNPNSIDDEAPEKFWVWSCCNQLKDDNGCSFDRHIPIDTTNNNNVFIANDYTKERSLNTKAFYGTESIVFYD